ncbi:hypothetical protein LCGC14_2645100 [marine sediment metagenome]|uniref:Uncharacterized protein n=1 Tax=marine sediment metagenome TaxID=412755 RepID=A0A0F9AIR7_9ZZZZ
MEIKTKEQYIEDEELSITLLEDRLSQLKEKWFKLSATKKELEFLEAYIKLKKEFVDNLK